MGKGSFNASAVAAECAGGCGFVVTGVTPTHCCRACQRTAGAHGRACMKKELEKTEAAPATASEAPTAAPETPATQACANGCGFVVTGITPTHCCRKCQRTGGVHGRGCMKKEMQILSAAAPAADAPPSPREVPAVQACANGCGFAVTGVTPDHCCRACQRKAGKHGPACMKKDAAEMSGSSDEDVCPQGELDIAELTVEMTDCLHNEEPRAEPELEPAAMQVVRLPEAMPKPLWETLPLRKYPGYTPMAEWGTRACFQLGNAAHEIRGALRFWSALVGQGPQGRAEDVQRALARADKNLGGLEAVCRRYAGLIRCRGEIAMIRGRPLVRIQNVLEGIFVDLSALEVSGACEVQSKAVMDLLSVCGKLTKDLVRATMESRALWEEGQGTAEVVLPQLPYVGSELWSEVDQKLARSVVDGNGVLSSEDLAAAGRAACNAAHELQNASVPTRELEDDARSLMKKVDNIAGTCEGLARRVMILSHFPGHARVRASRRAQDLVERALQMRALVTEARRCAGGEAVPAETCDVATARLEAVARAIARRAY